MPGVNQPTSLRLAGQRARGSPMPEYNPSEVTWLDTPASAPVRLGVVNTPMRGPAWIIRELVEDETHGYDELVVTFDEMLTISSTVNNASRLISQLASGLAAYNAGLAATG